MKSYTVICVSRVYLKYNIKHLGTQVLEMHVNFKHCISEMSTSSHNKLNISFVKLLHYLFNIGL